MVLIKTPSLSLMDPEGKVIITTLAQQASSDLQMNFAKEKKIKPGFNYVLALLAFMGTFGNSIPAGYNMGVINIPQTILKDFCNNTLTERGYPLTRTQLDTLWAMVVSIFLAGAVVGSISAAYLANRFGRKPTLMVNGVLGLISAAFFAFSEMSSSVELLISGRILCGLYAGLGSSVVPMYLMETCPSHMRGAFGVMQQFGFCTGILISQILGQYLGTEEGWPVLLSLYGIGIALGLFALVFCPRSPSYLYIIKKDEAGAIRELEKLRQMSVNYLDEDMLNLKKEQKMALANPTWTMWKVLTAPEIRLALLLVCAVQAGQQLSGISAVFYYSSSTFKKAGMTDNQTQYGSIGAGVVNTLMAVIAVYVVNRSKRRPLILISTIGSVICLIGLSVAMATQHLVSWLPFVTIAVLLMFVCIYGLGLGPLAYMFGGELFQQGPRAAGCSLGSSANWLANFTIAFVFPYLQELCSDYVFIIFAFNTFLLTIFLYKKLPETKGLDPVEVAICLQAKSKLPAHNLSEITSLPESSRTEAHIVSVI